KQNGYLLLKGKQLREFLSLIDKSASDIHVGSKTTQLGVFNFRAFLNLAMLLQESERAKILRQTILDVVIDVINQKTGGGTKYINQRDEDFLLSYFQEENYRKEFTDALKDFVDMGKIKYAIYTDKIYVSIFKEKAKEYRKLLKLEKKEKIRDTFYSEILDLIASYEYGFAKVLEDSYKKLGNKLSVWQVDSLFSEFESQAHWKPLLEKARVKMASRDLAFRDALHKQLEEYIIPLDTSEFERFLGEKSKELIDRLEDAKDVMKRLKER
ncbi:MAG: DNA-binding protein, partial [Bacteroidetes bacterium]|nr:DNA-binding protein [Bacteroidota bacterium]